MTRISAFELIALLLATAVGLTQAAGCTGNGGVANGECVCYGNNCYEGHQVLGCYRPTCEGNCFQYDSFTSIQVAGDGIFGTRCHVYSDDNCQDQIIDTGNEVTQDSCHSTDDLPGKSMKCYYRC